MEPGIQDNFRQYWYTLDLQVWRPSPTVDDSTGTGCYSLVGNNRFSNIDLSDGVARITPSPQDYIQFQPGDVLGFYVEDANDGDNGVVALTTDCPQISPTPTPYPITPSSTTTMATEGPIATTEAPKPQTEEPTIATPELITDEPTKTEPITDEITITTDEPLFRNLPTNDMPVTNDEATIDNSTVIRNGPASQPLLVGTVAAAVSAGIIILLLLIILVSVIICKKRSKSFNVTQQSSLRLGVTNRLQGTFIQSGLVSKPQEKRNKGSLQA